VAGLEADLNSKEAELRTVNQNLKQRRDALTAGGRVSYAEAEPSRAEELLSKAADVRFSHM
jgi:hypothetical protein